MPRLEVTSGKLAGKGYELNKALILGRGETADVQFPDGKASREHCRVFQQAGQWAVADLNSRNGISVNGVKTTRKNLRHGDVIEVGETQFRFVDAAAAAAPRGGGDDDVDELDIGGDDEPAAPARPAAAAKAPPSKQPAGKAAAKGGASAKDAAFAAARAQAAEARRPAGGGKSAAPVEAGLKVSDKVLQFNKVDGKAGSALGMDLSQYSSLTQFLIWGGMIAGVALICYGVFKAFSG